MYFSELTYFVKLWTKYKRCYCTQKSWICWRPSWSSSEGTFIDVPSIHIPNYAIWILLTYTFYPDIIWDSSFTSKLTDILFLPESKTKGTTLNLPLSIPHFDSNIPTASVNGVYISQLICHRLILYFLCFHNFYKLNY